MKISLRLFIAGSVAATLFLNASDLNRERFLSQLIHQSLENLHYSEKKINDDFSARGFKEYVEFLDYSKRYFLQSDIDEFKQYINKIDDELMEGRTDLMRLASNRIQQRISEVMNFYEDILSKPFDFSRQEFIELDGDKRCYCINQLELKEYWRKILKYHCLINYANLLRAKDKNDADQKLEKQARKAVLKSYKSIFHNQLQAHKNDAAQLYFNALVQVFDPHSNYLPPKEKEDFDIEMTGQFEGIGALLREEDGFVKVVRIIPGGPSWRQKQLQPGDLILKVAQGDEEPVDIVGMRVVDAVKLIRGKKGSLVRLTLKKPDEQIVTIPIVRDVVIVEESFAKSAFLSSKKIDKTFGYIYLPRFYRDFSRPDGRNATDDVRKIVDQFNRKKVDGLILDLRNNSGGSLIDAINISGLFISRGPIVQVKNRRKGIRVLRDRDKKIDFKGPMVDIINALSASASEILAAALQDYRRAIIVGGNHSYGKGTVQIMIDLDRYLASVSEEKDKIDQNSLGALKLTVQKFYRITGSSNQFKGVVPDIILPDRFDYLEIGEKYLDNSLPWDTITAVSFSKWDAYQLDLEILSVESQKRTANHPYFNGLKLYVENLSAARENTRKSLHFETFYREQQQMLQQQKEINQLQKEFSHITVSSLETAITPISGIANERSGEQQKITADIQQEWFQQLKKDSYLEEAMMIIQDIIQGIK
ncbi:MAG: carboxy terminal-processing peptidase [Candidatus Aminicenantes bacterium]|nr:carboxy terminal-processing peptidase [Candidatus Aminicenantes bacterium]